MSECKLRLQCTTQSTLKTCFECIRAATNYLHRAVLSSSLSSSPTFKATTSSGTPEEAHDRFTATEKKDSVKTQRHEIHNSEVKPISKTKGARRDPLDWFGILVPPALRASQEAFSHAVVESIPSLATVIEEMHLVEEGIRRKRQELLKEV